VLGVGELGARKDFATLIRAVARVRERRRCRLLIIGRGRQRDALLALGNELGFGDDLALPGFVENPYAYMRAADVFVSSSRYEGFANVVAEALAAGVPVVSTDCPSGPREILENGKYGRLVPVGDDAAMATAIASTLDAPPTRETLRTAAQRYRVDAVAEGYLAALGFRR
jgi:glycosyltransferase involved in cell wall biosynthesis